MAAISGFRLFSVALMLFVGTCDSAAGQVPTASSDQSAQSTLNQVSTVERPSFLLPMQDADGDFRKRVEARWNAARKGQIVVSVAPDAANHETFMVHVVVTRAPAGSDGIAAASSAGADWWKALLKLDDEVLVRLSPEAAGTLEVESHDASPDALIRHLDPGGHAEWTWTVRRIRPGETRLLLQADVVYRRKFSPGGKPVVTYPSAKLSLPVDAPPIPAK